MKNPRCSEPVEGIVIRIYPSGDSDMVLRVITREYGKLTLISKFARKSSGKSAVKFDIFDKGQFEIRESSTGMSSLRNFISRNSFHRLRSNLDKMTVATFLCECMDNVVQDETNEDAHFFEILELGLRAVEESADEREILRAAFGFLFGLLNYSGHLPERLEEVPNPRNMRLLLDIIERVGGRDLKSRGFVSDLIERIRVKHSGTREGGAPD